MFYGCSLVLRAPKITFVQFVQFVQWSRTEKKTVFLPFVPFGNTNAQNCIFPRAFVHLVELYKPLFASLPRTMSDTTTPTTDGAASFAGSLVRGSISWEAVWAINGEDAPLIVQV